MFLKKNQNIFLTGHNGMLGQSLYKNLISNGYNNIILKSKKELDLLNFNKLKIFLKKNKIDCIIHCAAKVGGIISNSKFPADYIIENSIMNTNLITLAHKNNINKFINIGSSCIYPKKNKTPIKESYLLNGILEQTNEYYAISKIHSLKLCQSLNIQYNRKYFSIMPTNLYGPNDHFDKINSHVIPALILKIYNAKKRNLKKISIIGNGLAKRDFLYVDDLTSAIYKLLNTPEGKIFKTLKKNNVNHINIGSSNEILIKQLVNLICKNLDYKGDIIYDNNKLLNGTKSKILDNSIIHSMGWKSKININEGLSKTINWFKNNNA